MEWQQIAGSLLQAGLPALGGLFGGPLGSSVGGIVGKGIAAALGVEPTPAAVAQKIQADPSGAAVALAQVEAETQRQAAQLADMADARAMETAAIQAGHGIAWVPVAFSVLNYVILAGVIACVATGVLREDGIIVGFALGAATSAYNFWLGSSEAAKRSNDAFRQFATTAVTAAPAPQRTIATARR